MLFGGLEGSSLELRDGQNGRRVIRGRFPYNKWAVLSDGGKTGRPQKERFAPGAFRYSLENVNKSPIHLLFGHSYDRPLASTDKGWRAVLTALALVRRWTLVEKPPRDRPSAGNVRSFV